MLHLKSCHLASSFNRTALLTASCTVHTAKLAQDWIATNCSEFISKDEWPPKSLDHNPLDYHVWGAMLERYKSFQPKPENIDELKIVLQLIWDQLPQDSINKAILSFSERLRACVKVGGGHFEHTLKWTTCQILVFVITVSVSWQWKLQVDVDCWLLRAKLEIWHSIFI